MHQLNTLVPPRLQRGPSHGWLIVQARHCNHLQIIEP
jgi:hypothetical protein